MTLATSNGGIRARRLPIRSTDNVLTWLIFTQAGLPSPAIFVLQG